MPWSPQSTFINKKNRQEDFINWESRQNYLQFSSEARPSGLLALCEYLSTFLTEKKRYVRVGSITPM